jgi:hypothetical protein
VSAKDGVAPGGDTTNSIPTISGSSWSTRINVFGLSEQKIDEL